MSVKATLRKCPKWHAYYKSSDCPTCPTCEQKHKPKEGFLSLLSAPARRALEGEWIKTLKQLAKRTEKDLLKLHGFWPATLPILREVLKDAWLSFNQ